MCELPDVGALLATLQQRRLDRRAVLEHYRDPFMLKSMLVHEGYDFLSRSGCPVVINHGNSTRCTPECRTARRINHLHQEHNLFKCRGAMYTIISY